MHYDYTCQRSIKEDEMPAHKKLGCDIEPNLEDYFEEFEEAETEFTGEEL